MTAIEAMLQQPVAQAIGWALVQFVWQGALIGAATACLLAALRRSAADIRYVVATISLALMLTMPVVTAVQSLRAEVPLFDRAADAMLAPPGAHTIAAAEAAPAESVASRQPDRPAPKPAITPIERWLPIILGIWIVGVATLTLRLLSGWLWVHRMRSHGATPAAADVDALAKRLRRRLHIGRPVRLLESSVVDVPAVIGWLKPVVLLPASTLAGLTPEQLEAVLAHELAHIRRHDYLVNLLQTVVETLLFYHPAVWWLSRRIRIERENCCDDLAVSLCGDPVTYASALAEMEGLRGRGRLVLAASGGGSLVQRVRRLLGAPPSHAGRAPGWLAAALAVAVIVGISITALGDAGTQEAPGSGTIESALEGGQVPPAPPEAPEPPEPAEFAEIPEHALELERGPEPPGPPQPPDPPVLAKDLALAGARAMAVIRQEIGGPISRDRAARRCMEWIRDGLPAQLRGHAHTLRGACEAIVAMQALVKDEARAVAEMAREAAAIAPIAVDAAAEPIAHVAAAIVEASQAGTGNLEPVLAEVSRAIGEAYRHHAARTKQSSASAGRQKSGSLTWTSNGDRIEVSYRGDVEFTDDDSDVRRISQGGWLRIKERRRSGPEFSLEFTAGGDGTIERRFRVGGTERPFDPEGRKWAADALPRIVRQTGIGAARRVRRIHASKGTAGVLAEIGLIQGGWGKRVYYGELLALPSLTSRDVQQALQQAGTEIASDFELASLLISANQLVRDEGTRKAYLDAARSIESDFEMRRVFSAAFENGPVAPAFAAGILDASTSIQSDFEAASLLAQVAKLQRVDAATRPAFFRALETVGSSFERRRVLSEILTRTEAPADVLAAALESAAGVDSDFECASVLLEFAKAQPVEGNARAPFFKAVSTIDSPFERGRVLQAVAKRGDASPDTILEVIRSAESMGSTFEKAQVLLAVAGSHKLTREQRDAYIDAAQRLGDFEQGRVLAALRR